MFRFEKFCSGIKSFVRFYECICTFLLLILIQMCQAVKFCSDLKRFVPSLRVYLYLFAPNFNTNVSSCKVLFQIQKCCSVSRSVLSLTSIQMRQLIEFRYEFKSIVTNFEKVLLRTLKKYCYELWKSFVSKHLARSCTDPLSALSASSIWDNK